MARWFIDRSPQRGVPSLSLRRLLPDAQFVGCVDGEVSGCSSDPRTLDPGQWFVAVRGEEGDGENGQVPDGHLMMTRALERGAVGVVVERPCAEAGRLQVVVGDARSAHARISHALAGDPAEALPVVGVTGASGKSAVGSFLRAIFRAEGRIVGSVGPATWFDGDSIRPIGPKAPDASKLAGMLAKMIDQRCDSAVLEVDHRGVDRREVDGIALAAAVVTTLGEADGRVDRRRSYARLIRRVDAGGSVIIDADDPDADVLGAVNLSARRVTFGVDLHVDAAPKANVSAVIDRVDAVSSRFLLRGFDRDVVVTLRVGGGHSTVRHALAATAAAWSQGVSTDAVVRGLESVARIPGRFESIRAGQPFEVRVDQAQSAGQLARTLAHLRAITPGRTICVVGAEGRDHSLDQKDAERSAIGRSVEAGADLVVLTSSNPRGDDPNEIIDEIRAGMIHPGHARVEVDRQAAIAFALAQAQPGDGVLIAGKGAFAHQILADRVVPFDDAAVATQILHDRHSPADRVSA